MEVLEKSTDEIKDIVKKSSKDKKTWDLIGTVSAGIACVGLAVLAVPVIGGAPATVIAFSGLVVSTTGCAWLYARK